MDDEQSIRDFISLGLRHEGYEVEVAADGHTGLRAVSSFKPHLVIADLMMPRMDGWEMCRAIAGDQHRGIIILSARDETGDRIQGLELGADDYLVKPFDFGQLLARIRALQRRPAGTDTAILVRGGLELDPNRREVTAHGRPVRLSTTEFNILELLMRRAPQVVDRNSIAQHAWRDETDPLGSNAIDVRLSRLRAKLPDTGMRIVTVRGSGYRLEQA